MAGVGAAKSLDADASRLVVSVGMLGSVDEAPAFNVSVDVGSDEDSLTDDEDVLSHEVDVLNDEDDVLSHDVDVDVTVQSWLPTDNLIEPASQGVQFPSVPLP
jgi:hypothetical protein